jgi:outer membrane protein assembly factor BamB
MMHLRRPLISSRARNIALSLCSFVFAAICHAQTDMLVADFMDDAVLRYNGTTGEFLGTFASHASLDGVASITYGSDGKLYVLGEFSLNVLRFDGLTGAFIDEFISASEMGGVGLTDPGFMEFGSDGNLYILHHISSLPDAVFKFDGTTGAFISTFATGSGMAHTHGLTFGSGFLYIGDLTASTIERYDAATGVFLGASPPDAGLTTASSIVFGPDGLLYVTNIAPGGLNSYDPVVGAHVATLDPGGAVHCDLGTADQRRNYLRRLQGCGRDPQIRSRDWHFDR